MQWCLLLIIFSIKIAFVTGQVAGANLTTKHRSMVHRCSTFLIHRVNVETFFDEVTEAHRLVPLSCNMKHIHAITISTMHVRPMFD